MKDSLAEVSLSKITSSPRIRSIYRRKRDHIPPDIIMNQIVVADHELNNHSGPNMHMRNRLSQYQDNSSHL